VNTYGTAMEAEVTAPHPVIVVGVLATTVSNSIVPFSLALAVIVEEAPTIAPVPPLNATALTTRL
jgi:hypothetical protein